MTTAAMVLGVVPLITATRRRRGVALRHGAGDRQRLGDRHAVHAVRRAGGLSAARRGPSFEGSGRCVGCAAARGDTAFVGGVAAVTAGCPRRCHVPRGTCPVPRSVSRMACAVSPVIARRVTSKQSPARRAFLGSLRRGLLRRFASRNDTRCRQWMQAAGAGYRRELMIWRYASSGNAFSDVVRTLPSLPSISVKRAATASSSAS